MKIAIIGAAGVRTPLILKSILARQDRLGIHELALMDIDGEHLELIQALSTQARENNKAKLHTIFTTDPGEALKGSDFVITTFRVGGIESRAIDERVPLNHGLLGQETTGAGGFAMGIRSIPVILEYIHKMEQVCPKAWLINFANPAGMLTEAVIRQTGWKKAVGICDGPTSMLQVIAALLKTKPADVSLDYFGLNHLGWIRGINYDGQDYLTHFLSLIQSTGIVPGLPFDPQLIFNLGMIPNEYLYYYYYSIQAVNNILKSGESRGEQIVRLNKQLWLDLAHKYKKRDLTGMLSSYQSYGDERGGTYMLKETGKAHDFSGIDPVLMESVASEGYAGVALDLIEGLIGNKPVMQILNVPNQSSITGFDPMDVVEISTKVDHDRIQPLPVGDIPSHCLGLMKQVKDYEHLTIQASVEGSLQKAILALTVHPLVRDLPTAISILKEYISLHGRYFPALR